MAPESKMTQNLGLSHSKGRVRPNSSKPNKAKKSTDPLLRSSQRQNAWTASAKHIPKNILADKERLYEESLQLKKSMNLLKTENLQLKTKVQQEEKELAKRDKEIKELLDKLNTSATAGMYHIPKDAMPKKQVKTSAHLVMGLKKRIAEISKENKTLKDGIENLKKSLKQTSTQELDNELKAYMEECLRLRKMLEVAIQNKPYMTSEDMAGAEEKLKQQSDLILKLQQENQDLNEKISITTDEIKKWKTKVESKKSPSKSPDTSQIQRDQMREIQKLKDQIEVMKKAQKSSAQAEELNKAKEALGKQEKEHEEKIRDMEMQLIDAKREKDKEIKDLKEKIKNNEKVEDDENEPEEAKNMQKILNLKEVAPIALELRLNLILSNIAPEDIRKTLFKNCDDNEKISIHEVARILKRSPSLLKPENAIKLARYIIEPRIEEEINYDELLEEQLSSVLEGIMLILGEYTTTPNTNPQIIQESLLEKVKEKIVPLAEKLQETATDDGNVQGIMIEEINNKLNLGLSVDEIDYILISMYKKAKDIYKLQYADLLEHLSELGCQIEIVDEEENAVPLQPEPNAENNEVPVEEHSEPIPVEQEPSEEHKEEVSNKEEAVKFVDDLGGEGVQVQENTEKNDSEKGVEKNQESQQEQPPEKVSESQEDKKVEELENMNEEQMIEIAQKCFSGIAEKMIEKGMNVTSLFKEQVYYKRIKDEEVELISPENFMAGLQKLGLTTLSESEKACLEKMLTADNNEKGFRVKDLIQILEDYGITESGRNKPAEEEEAAGEMKFEELDKVSMVLLLALTEYLMSAKVPLYELFGDNIYKQPVQVDDNELEIDIINSPDFFKVLHGIGIDTEEKEHENLKSFLCIDSSYLDKFSVDKLKSAIEEFAVNEELRSHAQQCYQELVEEEQLEEEPVEGHQKGGSSKKESQKYFWHVY